jgi:TetR/AcrR family transcriptional repressor of mexJK operon
MARSTPRPAPDARARATGPGRPKDLGKRAAILEAAKSLFTRLGYEGVSMDAIAQEAGVSKLTVYNHFGDKEALFAAAVKAHCEQGMPATLLEDRPSVPLRQRLTEIGAAFYSMITSPAAIAGHRMLCAPQLANSALSQMFWDAGPRRVHERFEVMLRARVAAGELEITDFPVAASQFFTLLKGEPHARLVFGCACSGTEPVPATTTTHVAACVEMFLRAYAARR